MTKLTVSRLLAALARLNQIGAALNQQGAEDFASLERTLQLIVESAAEVVPGSSATIYPYDPEAGSFDFALRVSTDPEAGPDVSDLPRPEGMGWRSVASRQRVLSYEIPQMSIHPAKTAAGAQVVACYPLAAAEQILGVLYIYLHDQRRFSDLELLLLENFVNLAAITLSAVQRYSSAQQEQARKEKELRRLRRAGMLISSRSSLRETLETILRMALDVTEARYGIFRLVDAGGQNLVAQAFAGEREGRPAVETLPIAEPSIMGWVARNREPLLIDDLLDEPWREIYYPLDHEIQMRSELAVPLIGAGGRLEGVLNLESPQVGAFSKQNRYILQIMANHAVTAIQEVRLLDVLQEISERLLTQPYPQVHQALVARACNLLNVPISLIALVEDGELILRAASDSALVGRRLPLQDSLIGRAIRIGAPVTLAETERASVHAAPEVEILPAFDSALIVPLFGDELSPGAEAPI
ncbi:MAG TPA: GAF domain-containing protein, partial [Anaerolineales bacterium]|nr:GAF domain-containing protein [Anaerolineales bacterium]